MPLLLNAILILWISTVGVQAFSYCNFPKINHGIIYGKEKPEELLPISIGEIYYYSCEYNFASPSRSFWTRIICTEQGWSPTPKCLRLCFFPSVENGHSASSGQTHLEGDIVQIVCDVGYSLPDNSDTITCLEDGWSSPPKCSSTKTNQLKSCRRPILHTEMPMNLLVREYNHSARINYRCLGKVRRMQSICINGKWYPEPDCRGRWREFCPPAPQIPNAQDMLTTVNYLNTAKVAVLCKENYLLHGPREIVCKNGQWQSLPQCIESTQYCGPPPPISNGDISSFPLSVYPPGSTVQYRCQSFYELRGPIDVICRNGQWSEPPKCIDPCIISEGNMNKNNIQLRWKDIKKLYVKTGDFVEFECKPPYKARTSAQSFRILCREGKLEYPTCE
ncbi:complement factor H-related protein 5 isoform X5 [Ursus arctos]|uniref:complement factor H-related protein 5 isoform X5 n=1 Tax=Ursus arctos TaxID=9644 RepID=UPI001CF91748|nr:complement factor H-related protein 5 isoform X5 [Ursus arctos]